MLGAAVPEDIFPVQGIGLALVTLPGHLDHSSAGQVCEQLLLVIDRGVTVLIADMTATVSCDSSGADALASASRRADASGTQLRLAVTAEPVREVLTQTGLDRLVPVYPTVAAALAGAARGDSQVLPDDSVERAEELLDWVVNSIFIVAVSLQTALDLPRAVSAERIAEALGRLDDVVIQVRHQVFANRGQGIPPDLARRLPPDVRERLDRAGDRGAVLRQRMAQTAYTIQFTAADTAALLEQRADLLRPPGHIDYPTEIKRWRALADQAGQMAERWEQWPGPPGRTDRKDRRERVRTRDR